MRYSANCRGTQLNFGKYPQGRKILRVALDVARSIISRVEIAYKRGVIIRRVMNLLRASLIGVANIGYGGCSPQKTTNAALLLKKRMVQVFCIDDVI